MNNKIKSDSKKNSSHYNKKNNFDKNKRSNADREYVDKENEKSQSPKRKLASKPPYQISANLRNEQEQESVVTTKSLTVAKKISSEMKIYGVNACLAAFARRGKDTVRVYVETDKVKTFSKLLKQCAKGKIAYKIVDKEELNKVTDTTHHEGICLIIRKKEVFNFKKFLSSITPQTKNACVVALENVQNPHNVGAFLRVCANFGVDALLLQEPQLALSGAVYRTAEGGAEWVQVLETGELLKAVEEFKRQGFQVYGTSSHGQVSLEKNKFEQKCVILFGSESHGLSPSLLNCCDKVLCIPQSGRVESLNISCAASVVLYEHFKQTHPFSH